MLGHRVNLATPDSNIQNGNIEFAVLGDLNCGLQLTYWTHDLTLHRGKHVFNEDRDKGLILDNENTTSSHIAGKARRTNTSHLGHRLGGIGTPWMLLSRPRS